MKRIITVLALAFFCALYFGPNVSALVSNGSFEAGDFSGWTKSAFRNNGLSQPPGSGGTDLSEIVGGSGVAALSLSDPRSNNNVRYPAFGNYSARVNSELSYNGGGFGRNGNSIFQTLPAYIDPSDGLAHVKFTYAAVMVNPIDHTNEQKPYFRVRVTNQTNGNAVLHDFQSFVGEAGKNWQNGVAFGGGNFWQYLNWTLIDLKSSPSNPVNVGDLILIEVLAAGCEPSGHPGYVYVDEITDNEVAGPTVQATAPEIVSSGSQITYTYNYRNGSSSTVSPTITATQPTGVIFGSVSDNTNCALNAGTVSCNFSNMAAGATGSFTVTGSVTASVGATIAHGAYQIAATGFPTLDGQTVLTNVSTSSTSTAITSSANPSVSGQNATLTATVTSAGGTPTGTVQFTVGGVNYGSPVALSGGTAQLSTSGFPVGANTVQAIYSGAPSFSGSTSPNFSQNVIPANSTVAVTTSPNPAVTGQGFTITANVGASAPGSGTPTGTVTFYINGAAVCTGVALSTGVATCSAPGMAPGNHVVTATYSGNSNFNGNTGTQAGGTTVNRANTTLGLTASPNPSVTGQAVTVTATVAPISPGTGTPTGTVTFSISGSPVCTNVTLSSAQATCNLPSQNVGNYPITATYGGDSNFNSSNGNLTGGVIVNPANTTLGLSASANPAVTGQAVTVTATVAAVAPGAGTPVGMITFSVNGAVVCFDVPVVAGQAACNLPSQVAGNHAVTATYSGSPNYNGSNGMLTGGLTVNQANTSTSVVSSVNPSVTGQSVTFTATVSSNAPGSGIPTGNVTFTIDGSPVCTNATMTGNQATCSWSNFNSGIYLVVATYNGDANYYGSTGLLAGSGQVVNAASTSTSVVSSVNPSVTGQSVTFTATVSTNAPGLGTPTGTVTFNVDGIPVCTNAAMTSGVATCTSSAFNTGTHPVSAVYSGNANYTASTASLAGGQVVNKANTTTAVLVSANPAAFGQTITFTANVTANTPGTGTPTGNVTFVVDGNTLCAGAVMDGGSAACSTSSLLVGSHSVSATYNSDPNFNGSTGSLAGGLNVSKADTTTTVAGSQNPSVYGQAVTFTATVAAVAPGSGTPTGTVSFNFDGILLCSNVAMTAGQAACSTVSLSGGTHVVTAAYNGDDSFNTSAGSLAGGPQIVSKADSSITITNQTQLDSPSHVGEVYPVNWTVTLVAPGAGTATGNVIVSDGSNSCTASASVQTCNITSTTPGIKAITATYAGDGNVNGSSAMPASHLVNVMITGRVQQFVSGGSTTDMSGVAVSLSGSATANTTTDSNGRFTFAHLSGGGSFVVTAAAGGFTFDPLSRSYATVNANVMNANFVGYDGASDVRNLRVVSQYLVPGDDVIIPLNLTSRGNESRMDFSLSYSANPLKVAEVECGSDALGCSISSDASNFERLGVSVTFAAPPAAGDREVVRVKFRSHGNINVGNTMITFLDDPTVKASSDSDGNPLATTYTQGAVIYSRGMESDVSGRNSGDGGLLANDIVLLRNFVVGSDQPHPMYNEFQRADSAPAVTKGDGQLDATDIVQARRFITGLDPSVAPGGPYRQLVSVAAAQRSIVSERKLAISDSASYGGTEVVVPVMISGTGEEVAASFTLEFDPLQLTDPRLELASGIEAILTSDVSKNGRISVLIDANSPLTFAKSERQLLNIRFKVVAKVMGGYSDLRFVSDPTPTVISDLNGWKLDAGLVDGKVTFGVGSSSDTRISGHVQTSDGRGLTNAQVVLTDSSGKVLTVLTRSFGYFSFEGLPLGGRFMLSVVSRRYTFESRSVIAGEDEMNFDLVARE